MASSESALASVSPDMRAEIVERTAIQRITAERMTFSFQTVPRFYLNVQVNMSQAVAMREALLPAVEAKAGVRLSFSDILVGAVAQSLRAYPDMNVSFENDQLKRYSDINVGLAMDTARGLTVPVFHRADQLSLAEIARHRVDVIERANENRLTPDDMSRGTFTISNLGMFGIDSFNAIINPPQAAILAVGRITKQAVVVEDTLQIQPTMWMTLSVDHRAVDGVGAARFLQYLVRFLEDPYKMLV
jgi:pyruvate dehydrogenase E2 component (dihydrolipoamide acetyltransferase)